MRPCVIEFNYDVKGADEGMSPGGAQKDSGLICEQDG